MKTRVVSALLDLVSYMLLKFLLSCIYSKSVCAPNEEACTSEDVEISPCS